MCYGEPGAEVLVGTCDGCGQQRTKITDAVIYAGRPIHGAVGGMTFAPHLPVPQPEVPVAAEEIAPEPIAETTPVPNPWALPSDQSGG